MTVCPIQKGQQCLAKAVRFANHLLFDLAVEL